MIRVAGLGYTFPNGTRALDAITFDSGDARVVGLLGENGAGKTTLLEILVGVRRADAGSVSIAGHPVGSRAARAAVGYLPSDCPVYPEMTVLEYLAFWARARDVRPRLADLANRLELGGLAGAELSTLSRGQRQRVGLAAALAAEPAVLVLDEPTTGLDPTQVAGLRELVRDISRRTVVVLSTHVLAEAEALCDRLVVLAQGRVVSAGARDEVAGPEGLAAAFARAAGREDAP